MCLTLAHKDVEKLVAEEDIICYKRLYERIEIKDCSFSWNGLPFTAKIKGELATGIVSVQKSWAGDIEVFLCTDDERFVGSKCNNKFGKTFSWFCTQLAVQDLVIDGIERPFVSRYFTPYQLFPVEIGSAYTSQLNKTGREVHHGFHSFELIEDCIEDMDTDYDILVKCIIPKGSLYYKGIFWQSPCYASNHILFVEQIPLENNTKTI